MDAKTKRALEDLAVARKIKKLMDGRFDAMLMGFFGNWPYYRSPLPDDFSKNARKRLVSQWKSYLKGLDMRMVTEKAMQRATRNPPHEIHLRDPATEWRDSIFGDTPAYIRIPEEAATKILVLGGLP